ncbi:hypothetical protein CPB85DRAFT_1260173 [Mucidula mucida]|nr:hypothetical protein CPB85DRAFT_1260173 [Mucidula mucida]
MTDWDAAAALDYAQRSRGMINLIKDLRELGFVSCSADTEFDLPRIAAIGNQSAGKSSLVEAIANIKVPRAPGTCTRCPMEFRLSYSARHKWQSNGQQSGTQPIIDSRKELEDMLLLAWQMAIVNPSMPSAHFQSSGLKRKLMSENELSFSPNIVFVDVSGPNVPGKLGVLKYVKTNFNNECTSERLMELNYAILMSCGSLWSDDLLQTVSTAIEQRTHDVSPHLKLMLQELINLSWVDNPDDAATSDT